MQRVIFCSVLLLCATLPGAQQTPTPPPAAEAKKPDAAKPAEPPKPAEKPFADLIKGAEEIPGLFTLYRTEEKVYLEIQPGQLDKTYMFSVTCESGMGERGIFASMMCGEDPIRFHKNGKNIQVMTRSPLFTAQSGTPIHRAVERSFAPSILASTKIESLPHPGRQSLLIELGPIFLADLPMMSYGLERTFRMPYRFDARNSSFGKLKSFPRNVEIETLANYTVDRPPLPPLLAPGAPPPPSVPPPRTLGDLRSLLLRFRYSISELPETGYLPRLADDRIGHFFAQREDFTTDKGHRPTKRYISRWHLEKADPSAALSRPKQPIVFWLENTIPVKYRQAVREGVLMWNRAFERIGFQDAVEARQQPDDAEWDPADVRYNTIRWLVTTDAAFAIGPSRSNPFTGQKYDSDIGVADALTRVTRNQLEGELQPLTMQDDAAAAQPLVLPWNQGGENYCTLGHGASLDLAFSSSVLEARGIDPDSPEAEKFVNAFVRWVIAHEVGHTLGLRHNFRGSAIHTLDQNQDPDLTQKEGLASSMMEYMPANIAPKGGKQGEFYQSTLGPYDYWAIEYAYKPIPGAKTPEEELPELRKIAARAAEPLLAYATDEEAGGFGPAPFEMDPTVNRFDLGNDTLEFARRRLALSREIIDNMESKLLKPGEGYQVLRRVFQPAFLQSGNAMYFASKYVGGVSHYRDHFGDPNGRLPYVPVPAARQREALALLRKSLYSAEAFQFRSDLLNKLAIERFSDSFQPGFSFGARLDVPIHQMVLTLQTNILNRLLHPVAMSRILDSEVKAAQPFRLSELFLGLQEEIWSELKAGKPVTSYRRSLQREHLKRMTGLLLRDGGAPEDARTLARHTLMQLAGQVRAAAANTTLPLETRAHYSESGARIEESLKAQAQRTAF